MIMFPDPAPVKEKPLPLPKSIKVALLQGVKKGAETQIEKDAFNKHGDYEYASVDAVYGVAQTILAEVGLGLYLTEKEVIYDGEGKRIKFVFQVHLFTEEDEWTSPDALRTIIMPYTGPQTCQAAQSYVEKALFKHLLKLKTGEKDPEDSGMPGVDLEAAKKAKAKKDEVKIDPMKASSLVAKILADLVASFPDGKKMSPQETEAFAEKWGADISTLDEKSKTTIRNELKGRK